MVFYGVHIQQLGQEHGNLWCTCTATHSCQPSWNGRVSPGILGLVPVMLVMSRIYTHVALPSAGFHSLMAAPRISSVLSSLVLFDTHKATIKTVLRHFLTEKSQKDYNFWFQRATVPTVNNL